MKLKVRRSFRVFQIITIKEEAASIGDRDTGQAVNDKIIELPPAKSSWPRSSGPGQRISKI